MAPGRLCFFGEHQDYLHLPVIAAALPLYCRIRVTPTASSSPYTIVLHVPQLQQTFTYELENLPTTAVKQEDGKPDFALASLLDAIRDGWTFSQGGAICHSTTDIPLQAGCSSSSAFCVAWIQVLHRLSHYNTSNNASPYIPLTPLQLAQRAYHAEVLHFGAPGGNMDHIASALGGTHCIGSGTGDGDFWHVEGLPPLQANDDNPICLWILVDSGEPKDTMGHLQRCKYDRLQLLEERLDGDWDANVDVSRWSEEERQLLQATLINRNTEAHAFNVWKTSPTATTATNDDPILQIHHQLAELMNRHHAALRDGLLLSTPRMEQLREAALQAGAIGFKMVGSGGGGCGVAWTPVRVVEAVEEALKGAGAKTTWRITKPSRGAYIIEEGDSDAANLKL
jgi:galactokinase